MKYNVKGLPKEEFLRLWDLVLIAREGIRYPIPYRPVTLYRVSDRLEDFSETDRPAITGDEYVGMYYSDGQIWFKSGQSYRDMQDTALHEIAHHEVPNERHGPRWRKVYGSALALHFRESGYEWEEIQPIIYAMVVAPYRVFRSITDPIEQQRVNRIEAAGIIRRAKSKISILRDRNK